MKLTICGIILSGMLAMLVFGCAGHETKEAFDMHKYYQALEETAPGTIELLEHGSPLEDSAVRGFKEFYTIFSAERIKASVRDVYAQDAYFRDGFREVRGLDNIEEYFLDTTEAVHECIFDIQDMAYNDGNHYFRWIMKLTLNRDRENPLETNGMSHVRFDTRGKVIFHQDYWETAALYERLPVIGALIRYVKKRI